MNMNQDIITRYIGQPARLPTTLRAQIEREWGGLQVQLYALADLDHTLRLAESWVAMGPEHVAVARAMPDGESSSRAIGSSDWSIWARLYWRSANWPPSTSTTERRRARD